MRYTLIAIASAFILIGCGGGGDDDPGENEPGPACVLILEGVCQPAPKCQLFNGVITCKP
jgi:hypothetical protein